MEFVAPYHHRVSSPHEFIFTPRQMLELADAIGPNVGLLVDCFHCHAAGAAWETIAQIPGSKIVLAHLNDCPNVPLTQIKDFERELPGDGVIDLVAFLKALKQAGYTGPVSLEVFNAELKKLPPAEAASRAWAKTKRILGEAGML